MILSQPAPKLLSTPHCHHFLFIAILPPFSFSFFLSFLCSNLTTMRYTISSLACLALAASTVIAGSAPEIDDGNTLSHSC
jgi:hypothetical protein